MTLFLAGLVVMSIVGVTALAGLLFLVRHDLRDKDGGA